MGLAPRRWDALLFLTLGLAIPASARALGALPVFALLTVPASGALLAGLGLAASFAAAAALGLAAAVIGYLLSWFGQLPTGATMVVVAVLLAAACAAAGRRRG
jgi:zinc transport system permease protein